MFENTELGHVRFHLSTGFFMFPQHTSGDACRARRFGPKAGYELRLHA